MQFIWQVLLTVCLNGDCVSQDVQWFESQDSCESMKTLYEQIPTDGNWDSVLYECRPLNSTST